MAVYTPAQLIASKLMGNGGANIATWRKQNAAGAGTFDIHRTTTFNSAAARAVTVQQGVTAADTAAQRIIDAEVLVANVVVVKNWWIAVPNSDYFEGFANAADVTAASHGYTYA